MKYLLLIWMLCPFLLTAQHTTTQPFRIYSTQEQKEIGLEELILQLQKNDIVFFGEEHTDSIAHVAELAVLQGLHQKKGKKVALSMEMFQTDVQLVLDEYLSGQITENNLSKDGKLWKNYSDYRPMVEYARQSSLYVLAANAPSRYTNKTTRQGLKSLDSLSEEARSYLAPLPIDTLTGRYYEKFSGLMDLQNHQSGIYQAQNLWDATMAWNICRFFKSKSGTIILHLNGKFHSDEKLGTFAQLQRYCPRLRCTNISAFSDGEAENPDWEKWKQLADFIIITGKVKNPL